jgi:hypothetical protein
VSIHGPNELTAPDKEAITADFVKAYLASTNLLNPEIPSCGPVSARKKSVRGKWKVWNDWLWNRYVNRFWRDNVLELANNCDISSKRVHKYLSRRDL